LESKTELVETSPTNLIENQETLCRERYSQIQDIYKKLERKAKNGELGREKLNIYDSQIIDKTFNVNELEIIVPDNFTKDTAYSMSIKNKNDTYEMNPYRGFDNSNIVWFNRDKGYLFCTPTINLSDKPDLPLKELNLFYNALTLLLQENKIQL
jgi:hypothetical protein